MKPTDCTTLIENYFKAYETGKRDLLEKSLGDDFHFSSPVDDNINRALYFERCWPNHKSIEKYDVQKMFIDQNEAAVCYTCFVNSGKVFENMELFKIDHDKISEIRCYFGFDLSEDFFNE